ncbi:MAG: VanZ family protein [Lachnospiraceae bacterium]|nr:VanZ family protein [Lachnospiraceae bacterium]
MKKEISRKKALHILIIASFIIYILALFYLTIGKSAPVVINGQAQRANLIPFHTIANYGKMIIKGHSLAAVAIINLAGNLLLLLPMAVYLPYFIKTLRSFWKDTLTVLGIILLIEIAEYITARGSFDIDDIILNLLGAVIGYGIWKLKPLQKLLTGGKE